MAVRGGLAPPPPMVIGGKEAGAEMEQAPPWFERGLVWLSVAWLAGGCVCVSVSALMGTLGMRML